MYQQKVQIQLQKELELNLELILITLNLIKIDNEIFNKLITEINV